MKKRKVLSLAFKIMMVLSLFVTTLPTITEASTFEDYSYKVMSEKNEIEITEYRGLERAVEIPSEIDGKLVTRIGEKAFKGKFLTSVLIPEGVQNIEREAFYGNSLTNITIPEGVTNIEVNAFGYNQISSVELPSSLTNLSGFNNNNSLESITIPSGVTNIGNLAFSNCRLREVTIPEKVTSIGDHAFYKNNLSSVIIPEKVKSIGEYTFFNNKLSTITIPGGVTFIGKEAFKNNKITPKDFIIYGKLGSEAELHARRHQFTFESMTVNIESISLNETKISLVEGTTVTLLATVLPQNATNLAVSWLSSNPSVAIVDKLGEIRAISEGQAIITVTTDDGDYIASCQVEVNNKTDDEILEPEDEDKEEVPEPEDDTSQDIEEPGDDTDWEVWESKYDTPTNKTWEVEFNKNLSMDTITERNIYVTNTDGEIIPMFYYQSDQMRDKTIYITPIKDYNSAHTYTLWIENLNAKDGSIVEKNVKMSFTIR